MKREVARKKAMTCELRADRLWCAFQQARRDVVDARRRWRAQPENPATRTSLKEKLRKEQVARLAVLVCNLKAERLANIAREAGRKVVAARQKLRDLRVNQPTMAV